MTLLRRGGLGAALLSLTAAAASACPQCAGRDDGGVGILLGLGAMILLPFGIVAVIVPVIRRGAAAPRS